MQFFLTNRWAMITLRVEEIRNAGIPKYKNLGMAEIASLVCRVESMRCPVRAELMAMSAVSLSRISPTMIMSGFCLIKERKPFAKVIFALGLTCVWLMP